MEGSMTDHWSSNNPRQLDFHKAMDSFKRMFPTAEEELIESVLRRNNGSVDRTVDDLLHMCGEPGDTRFAQLSEPRQPTRHDSGSRPAPTNGALPTPTGLRLSTLGDAANQVSAAGSRLSSSAPVSAPAGPRADPFLEFLNSPAGTDVSEFLPLRPPKPSPDELAMLSAVSADASPRPAQRSSSHKHTSTRSAYNHGDRAAVPDDCPRKPPLPPRNPALLRDPSLRSQTSSQGDHPAVDRRHRQGRGGGSFTIGVGDDPDDDDGIPPAYEASVEAADRGRPPSPSSYHKLVDCQAQPHRPAPSKYKPPLLGELTDDFLRLDVADKPPPRPPKDNLRSKRRLQRASSVPSSPSSTTGSSFPQLTGQGGTENLSSSLFGRSDRVGSGRIGVRRGHSARSRPFCSPGEHGPLNIRPLIDPMTGKSSYTHVIFDPINNGHPVKRGPTPRGARVTGPTGERLSTNAMKRKIMENEQRILETHLLDDLDSDIARYLEDQRLALMMQNEEFLRELKRNEDFMRTLEFERDILGNRLKGRKHQYSPPLTVAHSWDDTLDSHLLRHSIEKEEKADSPDGGETVTTTVSGGSYNQEDDPPDPATPQASSTAGAAASAASARKPDDTEFKRQLKEMGSSSRKQFAVLAKNFFSRRKKPKNSGRRLQGALTPSMVNLLDEDREEGSLWARDHEGMEVVRNSGHFQSL